MEDRVPPHPPTPAAEAQDRLRRIAGELRRAAEDLAALRDSLPETPDPLMREMCDGWRPFDLPTMLRGAIDCALDDGLEPAVTALETAAADTEASLAREWRRTSGRAPAARR